MKALCIKDHYVWDGDGELHPGFRNVKVGTIHDFINEDGIYYLNEPDPYLNRRGLESKYFFQMFKLIDEEDI